MAQAGLIHSWKMSGLKGQMPVHLKTACTLLQVAALGNVVLTRLGMSYIVIVFGGFILIHASLAVFIIFLNGP